MRRWNLRGIVGYNQVQQLSNETDGTLCSPLQLLCEACLYLGIWPGPTIETSQYQCLGTLVLTVHSGSKTVCPFVWGKQRYFPSLMLKVNFRHITWHSDSLEDSLQICILAHFGCGGKTPWPEVTYGRCFVLALSSKTLEEAWQHGSGGAESWKNKSLFMYRTSTLEVREGSTPQSPPQWQKGCISQRLHDFPQTALSTNDHIFKDVSLWRMCLLQISTICIHQTLKTGATFSYAIKNRTEHRR